MSDVDTPIPYALTPAGEDATRLLRLEAELERAQRAQRTAAEDALSMFVDFHDGQGLAEDEAYDAVLREFADAEERADG